MENTAPVAEGQVADAAPEAQGQAREAVWYDSAPDEVKGYIQNKGWDDPLKAVEGYQNLEKFHGVDPDRLIKLPKEGEPMDEVYQKLGRPEAAEKYEWQPPEGLPIDEGFINAIKASAYEKGVSQEAFEALANTYAQSQMAAEKAYYEQLEQEQTAQLQKLKSEWGDAFDERVEIGRRFVAKNLPNDIDKNAALSAIEEAIGTAGMLKLFANAGERSGVKEDKIPDSSGDRPFGYSPEQAKADKLELMNAVQADPERLANYNQGRGNDYEKMKKLNQIIAG